MRCIVPQALFSIQLRSGPRDGMKSKTDGERGSNPSPKKRSSTSHWYWFIEPSLLCSGLRDGMKSKTDGERGANPSKKNREIPPPIDADL